MASKDDSRSPDAVTCSTEEEIKIYKAAAAQMNIHVFVYDIIWKKIFFFNSDTPPFGILSGNEYTVEELLNSKVIDPDYTDILTGLFDGIDRGMKSTGAFIRLCNREKSVWNNVILANCFDSAGKPIRAIGTIQDVSHRVEIELRYNKEKQYRLAMMADSRRIYEINVTRDRFIKLESIQDSTDFTGWEPYTESMSRLCRTRVCPDDWEVFLKVATRENLLHAYELGTSEFYCEYRFIDNGELLWSSSATHLLKDPISDDIKGFIYVKDINTQKKRELELHQQAELDPLTCIYNRRTAEALITKLLNASDTEAIHGFLTLDFDDFKYVNDHFGHLKGDHLLKQTALQVAALLNPKDIFARMGGDEFIVFLPDTGNVRRIEHVASLICDCVHAIRIDEDSSCFPTISIGIATYPAHGQSFTQLYRNSDCALYDVKQHGKNHVSICSHPELPTASAGSDTPA